MQGRIKRGAGIFQGHHFGKWPDCCPPRSEYEGEEYQYEAKDPDMVFDVKWTGTHWDCKADGYGMLRARGEGGEYGNGSIFVSGCDGVELVGKKTKMKLIAWAIFSRHGHEQGFRMGRCCCMCGKEVLNAAENKEK